MIIYARSPTNRERPAQFESSDWTTHMCILPSMQNAINIATTNKKYWKFYVIKQTKVYVYTAKTEEKYQKIP